MKTICEDSLQYFPSNSEFESLHSTFIANCVFIFFLSHTTIVLNMATIQAIRKTASMPKTLKTLLLSLAVSDVGIGLLVVPFYIALLVGWLHHHSSSCTINEAFHIILYLFSVASFSGVVAVSVERFLAIHLHLRYHELVTHKRIVALVISTWLLSVLLSLAELLLSPDVVYVVIIIAASVALVVVTVVYVRIYLAVRRHKNQMQALVHQVQHSTQITSRHSGEENGLERVADIKPTQTGEMTNFATLVKSAFGTFYVYLVFLVCYLPHIISMAAIKFHGPSISLKSFFLFSMTLVFLNSVLNPIIYCWKMRHVRYAYMNILRKMITWFRSRALE